MLHGINGDVGEFIISNVVNLLSRVHESINVRLLGLQLPVSLGFVVSNYQQNSVQQLSIS